LPKKKKDDEFYRHFTIVDLDGGNVSVTCNHCPKYSKPCISKFNASHGRTHLINVCPGIDMDTKRRLSNGSQAGRRVAEHFVLNVDPTATVADMRASALAAVPPSMPPPALPSIAETDAMSAISFSPSIRTPFNANSSNRRVQAMIDSNRMFGPAMTKADADKIIMAEVKAVVARGEPLSRLLDPHVKASLCARHPALIHGNFLPGHESTIYNNYVVPIDRAAYQELESFIAKLPGHINISMDGAQVNHKQKVINYCSLSDAFFISVLILTDTQPFSDCVHSWKSGFFYVLDLH
jgi:hypothetical protein